MPEQNRTVGKPDFVFPRSKLAVFVDGCFWHGCPKHATQPATNRAFWKKKFTANKARDLVVVRTLRQAGWRVIRVWEHELAKSPHRCVKRIKEYSHAKPQRTPRRFQKNEVSQNPVAKHFAPPPACSASRSIAGRCG
ncbi:MAG: hypothetical protein HY343_03155 [Lentisphaerae bacterium]|nr:hypothetical protein [Lentisphaerota bacterium]